jgi:hypothetical protein
MADASPAAEQPPRRETPDNWDDDENDGDYGSDDSGEDPLDWESVHLAGTLTQLTELLPKGIKFDDLVRDTCEELEDHPPRSEGWWTFPLRVGVNLGYQDLQESRRLIDLAITQVLRILDHLNDRVKKRQELNFRKNVSPDQNGLFGPRMNDK